MPIKAPKRMSVVRKPQPAFDPVWKGPTQGGVTQSLLNRFLECRERFRLLTVYGLKLEDTFQNRLEYGQMWHVCEEAYAKGAIANWDTPLTDYCRQLCRRYPLQQEQVQHWYDVCRTQFPVYVQYWSKHPDVRQRTPLFQEKAFNVPYELPSGRVVALRGKWDSVDLIGKGRSAGVYLQENKTKGDIDEALLRKQLQFDLQTMIYVVALIEHKAQSDAKDGLVRCDSSIKGIRYNVIRRPLSGGRNSIRQHQPTKSNPEGESREEFYARLGGLIEQEPEYYFMRWKVELTEADIKRFRCETLNPLLESLCDWWSWITSPAGQKDPFGDHVHWRTPYGCYSSLFDGGSTPIDEYLATGSMVGLRKTDNLFPELT